MDLALGPSSPLIMRAMRQVSKGFCGVFVALSASWLGACALAADPETRPATSSLTTSSMVLVLPFVALNPPEDQRWLGRSIQQSLVADLTAIAPGQVLSSESAASDNAAAIEAGRKAGARYVVRGNFATAGKDTRITGQVFDVETGKPVTAIKATGPSTNVFWLEDDLAAQIRRRLALNPASSSAPALQADPPPMESLQMPAPAAIDPYALTYVAPVGGSHVPAQIDYDYFFAQPSNNYFSAGCFGSPWAGSGYGTGCGFFGNSGFRTGGRSGRAAGINFHASGGFRAGTANR